MKFAALALLGVASAADAADGAACTSNKADLGCADGLRCATTVPPATTAATTTDAAAADAAPAAAPAALTCATEAGTKGWLGQAEACQNAEVMELDWAATAGAANECECTAGTAGAGTRCTPGALRSVPATLAE